MRMVIASDLHGLPESLEFLLAKVKELKPARTVLLGDMLYHGPRNPLPGGYGPLHMPELFRQLMDLAPVTAVRGNCDAEIDLELLPFAMPDNAVIECDGLQIYASHGHHIPLQPPMGAFAPETVFLHGHTHVPRGETIEGWSFWNPGSMTLPKRGYPRSYAVYEDGLFRVLDFEGRTVLEHAPACGA